MKKKLVLSAVLLVVIFFLAYRFTKKTAPTQQQVVKVPQIVSTQKASDSKQLMQTLQFPGTVAGDQEITITAKAAGNALAVPVNLGDRVAAGSLLARIDDTGNNLSAGSNGFISSQIQQANLNKKQLQEQLDAAAQNYHDLKKAFDDQQNNPSSNQNITKAQVDSAREQIDILEIQLKSSKVGLKGTLDNHLITSPITGFVISKNVSVGDSVTIGQEIVRLSQTRNVKVQFFVDQNQLKYFANGININVIDNNGKTTLALVRNISPVADPVTKRFLIEAYPKNQDQALASGTVVSVSLEIQKSPTVSGDYLLPLSVITVGQNENYIFLNDGGKAQKAVVQIVAIQGEAAEIKANFSPEAEIIFAGSKLVSDGNAVNVQN